MKGLISMAASSQGGADPYRVVAIDIKRAYFYAPATRPLFIRIPREDREAGDEGMVARLLLSLYGTRDAAMNWVAAYTSFVLSIGSKRAADAHATSTTRRASQ